MGKSKKIPSIAAILNFFFFGLGYLYNGKRKFLGIALTVAGLINAIFWIGFPSSVILNPIEEVPCNCPSSFDWPSPAINFLIFTAPWISLFLIAIILAVDGYKEAKKINK
jgi:hypothetical protein